MAAPAINNTYETEIATLRKLLAKLEADIAYALDYVTAKRRIVTATAATLNQLEQQRALTSPMAAEAAGAEPRVTSELASRDPALRAYERYDGNRIAAGITAFMRARGGAPFRIEALITQLIADGVVPWRKPMNQIRNYVYRKHLRPAGFTSDRGAGAVWHPPKLKEQ